MLRKKIQTKKMNKVILTISLFSALFASAQTTVVDTVYIGAQYKDATYYQLSSGNKTSVLNTDWHLAFSVQPVQFPQNTLQSVTIRLNEGAGGISLHQKSLNDTAFFTGDTIGFSTFDRLYDTDNNLDTGAFNRGLNISQFDYGWGVYNQTTKNIPGRNVFYLQLSSGIKKFRVVELTFDTLWQVQYANLDNSNLQNITISKKQFTGKLFAYLNVETNLVSDREPLANSWDLLFHKYFARDVAGLDGYPSTGVWNNKGVEVAEARQTDVGTATYNNFTFTKSMNTIGRDWKEYVAPVWEIEDSLLYFAKTKNGAIYKLRLTEFGGGSNGMFVFEKSQVFGSTSIDAVSTIRMKCYPNPASNFISVVTDGIESDAKISISDLSGRNFIQQTLPSGFATTNVDVQGLHSGIYLLVIESNGIRKTERVVISR